MALPRDASAKHNINDLGKGLGRCAAIESKGVSPTLPKPGGPPEKQTAAPAGPRSGGKSKKKAVAFREGKCRSAESPSTAFELRQIARDVRRIHDPMRSNPEAVLVAKDAIAARLNRLADVMEASHHG